jgi:hypothetical protein
MKTKITQEELHIVQTLLSYSIRSSDNKEFNSMLKDLFMKITAIRLCYGSLPVEVELNKLPSKILGELRAAKLIDESLSEGSP